MPDNKTPGYPYGYAHVDLPPLPANPQADEEAIDLRELFSIALRRWKLMLLIFGTVVLAVCLFTMFSRPVYQATARILVNTGSSRSSSSNELPLISDLMGITQARSVQTQIEIIKSPAIKKGAMSLLGSEHRETLKEMAEIEVKTVRDADVIDISVATYSPRSAAAMANALCEEYMEDSRRSNREQTTSAARYVEEQMDTIKVNLDRARRDLRVFKQRHNTADLSAETQQRIARLSQMETELSKARADLAASLSELQPLTAEVERLPADTVSGTTTGISSVVQQIKEELTRLELSRIAALQFHTADSPEADRLNRQIAAARSRLDDEALTEVKSKSVSPDPLKQSLSLDAARLSGRIWAGEARAQALEAATADIRKNLSSLPEQEYELAQLSTDLGVLEQTYTMLNEKYQGLRISEEARLANARVISPAEAPASPIKPRKARNLALAVLLGLMLAAGTALIIDRLDNHIYSESDLREAVGDKPVLAWVPFVEEEDKRVLVGDSKNYSHVMLECFRMLRSNLTFAGVDKPIKSVAITSSEPNEGKTTIATNLAAAMAMDHKKVILVDADLRHPSVHTELGLTRSSGFSNVVTGSMTLEDALQETSLPGLFVLASGPMPPNPPELLNSLAARELFNRIFESADFVVIDCPPALIMTDAAIVSTMADASVLVVSAGEAGKHMVARTAEGMAKAGPGFIGVILNKLGMKAGGYYGYYGYGYYGYYGQYKKYGKYYADKEKV